MYNSYIENGVIATPNVMAEGDMMSLHYDGLLYKSGAHSVFARVGYGDRWDSMQDIRMVKTPDGFNAKIAVIQNKPLHVAFKDCANNWDNNSGMNYTFEVQDR